jgi:hypothetical protein
VGVGLTLTLLGAAAWQVMQMTECEGEGASRDRSAALDGYCDLKLHFLALLLPGVLILAGAAIARRRENATPFRAAAGLATLTAVSPIVAAFVLG